jgi:hypothetical protein
MLLYLQNKDNNIKIRSLLVLVLLRASLLIAPLAFSTTKKELAVR